MWYTRLNRVDRGIARGRIAEHKLAGKISTEPQSPGRRWRSRQRTRSHAAADTLLTFETDLFERGSGRKDPREDQAARRATHLLDRRWGPVDWWKDARSPSKSARRAEMIELERSVLAAQNYIDQARLTHQGRQANGGLAAGRSHHRAVETTYPRKREERTRAARPS